MVIILGIASFVNPNCTIKGDCFTINWKVHQGPEKLDHLMQKKKLK